MGFISSLQPACPETENFSLILKGDCGSVVALAQCSLNLRGPLVRFAGYRELS